MPLIGYLERPLRAGSIILQAQDVRALPTCGAEEDKD